MNLAVSRNMESITPDVLPPASPRDGRLRLLCMGLPILGLNSFNKELERYCAERDDVEAVHITLANSLRVKVMSRVSPLPGNSDFKLLRAAQQWRAIMRGWFRGPLPLDRFDAAIVCPQFYAWALADAKGRGQRLTLGVHIDATVVNTVRDFGDSALTTWPLLRTERRIFAQADLVSCMGRWAGDSARDDYGVPGDRVVWVPPTAPLIEAPARPAPGGGGGGRPLRIIFVGNQWARKGGPELLRWHQQRWAEKAELHFVGHDAAAEPGAPAPKNVTFHGRVERDRIINELLPTMDLFVLPTKREMSSWAGMEAMAAGLPVVLTHIGGIPDLVIEGETGFLAKPGDEAAFVRAIGAMIDDPARCRRMGEAARARARAEFNRGAVYSVLIDKVRELALGRSAASVA